MALKGKITSKVSPLEILRTGQVGEACELADACEPEQRALWHLLLALELKETNRIDELQVVIDRLLSKELARLSGWTANCAVDWLGQMLDDIDRRAMLAIHEKVLDTAGQRTFRNQLRAKGYLAISRDAALNTNDASAVEDELVGIASAQTAVGEFADAVKTAKAIDAKSKRAETLISIASAQAKARGTTGARSTLSTAIQIAKRISKACDRAETLRGVALAQARAGETEPSFATFADAVESAMKIRRRGDYGWLRTGLGSAFMPGPRTRALASIASAQAEVGQFDDAIETAMRIQTESGRGHALRCIGSAPQ